MRLTDLVENLCLGCGRGDGVDRNILTGEFLAEGFRQGNHACFGCGVGRCVRVPFLAGNRGNIDDPAIAVGDHAWNHCLAAIEDAVEINVDNLFPLIDRIIDCRHHRTGYSRIVH